MEKSYVISVEQLDTMQTAVWELTDQIAVLGQFLNKSALSELTRSADQFRNLLKEIREQHPKDDFDQKLEYFTEVAEREGFNSEWSVFEVEDLDAVHPYKDAKTVTYDIHWGPAVVVKEISGTKWKDLYAVADACIQESGDTHHRYIEGFHERGDTLVLLTGS
jgi:hypothetical protein